MAREPLRGAAIFATCLGLICAAIALGGERPACEPPRVAALQAAGSALRAPLRRTTDLYALAFASYALVNAAEPVPDASATQTADALIDRALQAGASVPFGPERWTVEGHSLASSAAYSGHLALMLEARARLGPLGPEQERLRVALRDRLAQAVLEAPRALLPTFGERTFPADNEVIAAALALDLSRTGGTERSRAALGRLQATLDSLEQNGLPASEVARATLASRAGPRGCAVAYAVAMRGLYDPVRARRLYASFRRDFFQQVGPLSGFREWPRGVNGKADADSGPVVLGFGAAASAFGIAAARVSGATGDARSLTRTAAFAQRTLRTGSGSEAALVRAVRAFVDSARPWATSRSACSP